MFTSDGEAQALGLPSSWSLQQRRFWRQRCATKFVGEPRTGAMQVYEIILEQTHRSFPPLNTMAKEVFCSQQPWNVALWKLAG